MKEEKDVFQLALEKAEELDKFNFNEKDGFDINEYYTSLEKIAFKNNSLKNDEAENVIRNNSLVSVNETYLAELEEKRLRVENFIRKYDPNKELVSNMELVEVDKIYAISNYLLNSYIQFVNEMKFNFELTKHEFKFLNKALVREIEYDADEVFNYAEFLNILWNDVQELAEENKSEPSITFVANIKMILILHHLIKGYKVKGSTADYTLFKDILFKIAQFNKLFNAYTIIIERIKADREIWGSALDEVANQKELLKESEVVEVEVVK